jgi:hypothetical protein
MAGSFAMSRLGAWPQYMEMNGGRSAAEQVVG